ncbi:MAG TPA: hypothetical protein VEU76_06620 [Candidatus Udaeobacter sp.]|nr:hypothetical protein [Candidatus Udaeobacter sp.]
MAATAAGIASTPACCCGVQIKPGPAATISGNVLFPNGTPPQGVAVYAIDEYPSDIGAHGTYVMVDLAPPATAFSLSVPPGYYRLVARLDSDPLSAWAHCFPNEPGVVEFVTALANQVVTGVDINCWQTTSNTASSLLWNIDTSGSPLTTSYPRAKQVASRVLPAAAAPATTTSFSARWSGVRVMLPSSWTVLHYPNPNFGSADFYANEEVTSPLQLDGNGVLLNIEWLIAQPCPGPDWRYATARTRIEMQGGAQDFYFEDPSGPLNSQPFTGYVLHGGRVAHSDCLELYFTGRTQRALESNLGLVEWIVNSATFGPRTD